MSSRYALVPYRPSGQLGEALVALGLLWLPLLLVLSTLYAYATIDIRGLFSVMALPVMVGGLGYALAYLARRGRCRNRAFVAWVGFLGGLVVLYWAWVMFFFAQSQRVGLVLNLSQLMAPDALWQRLLHVNRIGYYSLIGWTPTGIVLWLSWGLEAVVILLGIPVQAYLTVHRDLYCEACQAWCETTEERYLRPTERLRSLAADAIELNDLTGLDPLDEPEFPCIRCEVLRCPDCHGTKGLRFSRLTTLGEGEVDGEEHAAWEDIPGVYRPADDEGEGEVTV